MNLILLLWKVQSVQIDHQNFYHNLEKMKTVWNGYYCNKY